MPTFKRFEEMHAWQSARELVRLVYEITKGHDFYRILRYEIKFAGLQSR
jgi:hypothetical protein